MIGFTYIILNEPQEENMKLKKLKDELGEPLSWSDYVSLPFTQKVRTCLFTENFEEKRN